MKGIIENERSFRELVVPATLEDVSMTEPLTINSTWQPYRVSDHVDGLVQERRNSIANALELRLSCTNPSIYSNNEYVFNVGCSYVHRRWYISPPKASINNRDYDMDKWLCS